MVDGLLWACTQTGTPSEGNVPRSAESFCIKQETIIMSDPRQFLRAAGIDDLLYRRNENGDFSVRGDLIKVHNIDGFSREDFQKLIPGMRRLAEMIHNAANREGFSIDVISQTPFSTKPPKILLFIKPNGTKQVPHPFIIPLVPGTEDLKKLTNQMREMLPSA